jgi:hypothetical protein
VIVCDLLEAVTVMGIDMVLLVFVVSWCKKRIIIQ